MLRVHSLPLLGALLLAPACLPAPALEPMPDDGSTSFDIDDTDGAPYVPTTTTSSTGIDEEGSTDASSGDESPSTSAESSTTDVPADTGSETTGTGEWNEDGPEGFPGIEAFGDDVRELDLVGTWTTPWDPAGVADVQIVIADDGTFVWHERAADCSDVGTASGMLWVSGSQLVVHFAAWDKPEAWDAEDEIGVAIAPPYRMRLGYTPMGGYLGLAAPAGITAIDEWAGRGYVRLEAGIGAQGEWAGEAELWAMPPGEPTPLLVARDRFEADLGGNGNAQLVHARTWWYPARDGRPDDHDAGPWSDDTPGFVAGAATVIGVGHAYDAAGLFTFTPTRSFKLGVQSDCD